MRIAIAAGYTLFSLFGLMEFSSSSFPEYKAAENSASKDTDHNHQQNHFSACVCTICAPAQKSLRSIPAKAS